MHQIEDYISLRKSCCGEFERLMKTRKLFLLALVLVVMALLSHMTALRYAARSAKLTAMSIGAPAEAVQLRAERSVVNRRSTVALFAGISCALLSIVFAFLSRRADESAPRTIVVALLVFYGILQFALV